MKNIDIGLNGFPLPIYLSKDSDYYGKLSEVLNDYNNFIEAKTCINESVKRNVSVNCEKIIGCIRHYYNADIVVAQEKIMEILEKYTTNSPFIVSSLDESYAFRGLAPQGNRPSVYKQTERELYEEMMSYGLSFFRARVSSSELNAKDMFHIPFNKRSIISTQRFSIPGVPCLYLSTTSFGTWLELGMPKSESFQVSEYDLPDSIKVLNLCYQQQLINGKSSYIETAGEEKDFNDAIEIFPLIIASSFTISEENRCFKSEYIISQLIMQVSRALGIDAVAYLSKRMEDLYAYPQAVNIAILIPQSNLISDNLYWDYSSAVKLTEPQLFSVFLRNNPQTNCTTFINKFFSDDVGGDVCLMGKKYKYTNLSFAEFDEFLHGLPKNSF